MNDSDTQPEKKDTQSHFSKRLRKLRGSMTQQDFSEMLGIPHQSTYARYEAGRIPRPETVIGIANTLGVTVAFLYGEEDEEEMEKNISSEKLYEMLNQGPPRPEDGSAQFIRQMEIFVESLKLLPTKNWEGTLSTMAELIDNWRKAKSDEEV